MNARRWFGALALRVAEDAHRIRGERLTPTRQFKLVTDQPEELLQPRGALGVHHLRHGLGRSQSVHARKLEITTKSEAPEMIQLFVLDRERHVVTQ